MKLALNAWGPLLVALACGQVAAQSRPPAPLPPAAALVQQQLDAYNQHDLDAFMATYALDVKVFEYPDKLALDGAAKVRERYAQLFTDGVLQARLANRMVIGQRVIDHEFVTRTFAAGVGVKQWVAIYDVENEKIVRVTLIPGPVDMSPKP